MNQLRYKTLYCKKTNKFICVKYGVLEFVEVPVLYKSYEKINIKLLENDVIEYLNENSEVKIFTILCENSEKINLKTRNKKISILEINILKNNLHLTAKELHQKFFKFNRSYEGVRYIKNKYLRGEYGEI